MANHKSALKRHRQSLNRRSRNRADKSMMKTVIRAIHEAVATGEKETATTALQAAIPVIQHTAAKGTIHKNTASRKVSRLTRMVNKCQAAG